MGVTDVDFYIFQCRFDATTFSKKPQNSPKSPENPGPPRPNPFENEKFPKSKIKKRLKKFLRGFFITPRDKQIPRVSALCLKLLCPN